VIVATPSVMSRRMGLAALMEASFRTGVAI
jgi:hypothetical protein